MVKFDLKDKFKGRGDYFEEFCQKLLSADFKIIRKSEKGADFGIDLWVPEEDLGSDVSIFRQIIPDENYLVSSELQIVVQCKASMKKLSLKHIADSIAYADLYKIKKFILMTNNALTPTCDHWIKMCNMTNSKTYKIFVYDKYNIGDRLVHNKSLALEYFPELKSEINQYHLSIQKKKNDTKSGNIILDESNPVIKNKYSILTHKYHHLSFIARLNYNLVAGTGAALQIAVNGKLLEPDDLINKSPFYTFSDKRLFTWFEIDSIALAYSPDFVSNYKDPKYSFVNSDPYLFVFNISKYINNSDFNIEFKHNGQTDAQIVIENICFK